MNNQLKKVTCVILSGCIIGTLSSCKKEDNIYGHYDNNLINFETNNMDLKMDSLKVAIRENFFKNNNIINDIKVNDEEVQKFLMELNKRNIIYINYTSDSIKKFLQYFINYYKSQNLILIDITNKVINEIDLNDSSLMQNFKFNNDNREYSLFMYGIQNKSESIVQKVKYDDKIFSKKLIINDIKNKKRIYSVLEEYKLIFNKEEKMQIKIINTWDVNDKLLDENISNNYQTIIIIDYNNINITKKIDNGDNLINILYEAYLNEYDINTFIKINEDILSEIIGRKFKKISNDIESKKLILKN